MPCPNCGQDYYNATSIDPDGVDSGRHLHTCKLGCIEWEKDNKPGFKDYYQSPCCKCGEK